MSKEEFENIVNEKQISVVGRRILQELMARNQNLLSTINFGILDDKFTINLTIEELSRITGDMDFQQKLIDLSDEQLATFFTLKGNVLNDGNWITGSNLIVKALKDPKFKDVTDSIMGTKDVRVLQNYYDLINQDQNYFGITTIEQLRDYQRIKNDMCSAIIEEPGNETNLTESIKSMSAVDRVKFAKVEKAFGISLVQAKLLCQKYGFDIENSQEVVGNETTDRTLRDLTRLILSEDIEQCSEIELATVNTTNFNELDTEIREAFAEMYNSNFYKPKSDQLIETIEVDGQKVPIYDAGTNFFMCSHVVGAFSSGKEDSQSYSESWNVAKKRNHVFCTRLISNEALEIANENSMCYGFCDFDKSSLIASAAWDMASMRFNTQFDTIGEMDDKTNMTGREGSGSRFLTPMEQINNTRTDGNETNWDRFTSDGQKKQPAYIIWIAETLADEQYKEDSRYQESVEAAAQFGVPLVLIDRQRVVENEHIEIQNMMTEYEETQDPTLIRRIIQKFENNRTTGYRQACQQKYKTEFPLRIDESGHCSLEHIVSQLVEMSRQNGKNDIQLQIIIDELMVQATRSGNQDKDFCDLVYQVASLSPNLSVDMDKYLKRQLGITKNDRQPEKISKYYMKSFFNKRENIVEQHKTPSKFQVKAMEEQLGAVISDVTMSDYNEASQNIKSIVMENQQQVENENENERMGYG